MRVKHTYVPCQVSLGFFDTEFYVTVSDSSAFVDRSVVQVDGEPAQGRSLDGKVLAYIIDEQQADRALVELPGEAVVGGLRTWVPKSALAPQP